MSRRAAFYLILAALLFSSLANASAPRPKIAFALLASAQETDNIWKQETDAYQFIFDLMGWSYERVSFEQIRDGYLGSGAERRFLALVESGGEMEPRVSRIGAAGVANIQKFVQSGGTYIGFCAGAHHAANRMKWARPNNHPAGEFASKDYEDVPGPMIGLFPGAAIGPVGWNPMRSEFDGYHYQVANINTASAIMNKIGAPPQMRMYLTGGPYFVLDSAPKDLDIWATNARPEWMPKDAQSPGDGAPTIISFSVGEGKVILSAYHPFAIATNYLGRPKPERRQLAWHLKSIGEENYEMWNLLMAALRIGAGEPVQPLTEEELKGGRRKSSH